METVTDAVNKSTKSGLTTLLLGIFLGVFGAHRFYVGKIGTGILMILTLGGLGIWLFTDLIFIISNKFEDKQGKSIVLMRDPSPWMKGIIGVCAVFCEILVCFGLFFAIVFYFTSGLIKPIQNQLNAIQHDDMQAAYAGTAMGFQRAVSFEDFKKIIYHYPSLKNNASFSWTKREFQNDNGLVSGVLIAKDGAVLSIEYHLIKEDGRWKILSFTLNPKNLEGQSDKALEPLVNITAEKMTDTHSSPTPAYQIYEDKKARFSINYPTAWDISSKKPGQLYVTGKKGTSSFYSFISIHTIPAKKIGGKFSSAKAYIESFKSQVGKKYTDIKFLNEGEAELPQNPKQFHGEYIMFTFTHKNIVLKRMDFVIERSDGLAFYDWSYTAPEKLFDHDLPIAKTMYESWVIK
jgi:hypothetical protein